MIVKGEANPKRVRCGMDYPQWPCTPSGLPLLTCPLRSTCTSTDRRRVVFPVAQSSAPFGWTVTSAIQQSPLRPAAPHSTRDMGTTTSNSCDSALCLRLFLGVSRMVCVGARDTGRSDRGGGPGYRGTSVPARAEGPRFFARGVFSEAERSGCGLGLRGRMSLGRCRQKPFGCFSPIKMAFKRSGSTDSNFSVCTAKPQGTGEPENGRNFAKLQPCSPALCSACQ